MRRIVLTLCVAEVMTMAGIFAFPTLLPQFQARWGLSGTDSGWISGIFFGGYALAVPLFSTLTDRVDARRIYLLGAVLAGLSCLGFGLLADGFWTALTMRALGGVGLAGTYMPGLKALVDRTSGPSQPRWMSWYTASFSLGTSLSVAFAGLLSAWVGWRWMYGLAGLAAFGAVALVLRLHSVQPPRDQDQDGVLLDFRPVLANGPAMGFILGYGAHMWELFGLRNWIVAFLAFAWVPGSAGPDPVTVGTLAALMSMAASIGGADLATRLGRRGWCVCAALASGLVGLAVGGSAGLGYGAAAWAMVAYSFLVQLDSAALTTGAVLAARRGQQGLTIALHSLIGFGAAFLGPLVFGRVLDLSGGQGSGQAWMAAFASLGLIALTGPIALRIWR